MRDIPKPNLEEFSRRSDVYQARTKALEEAVAGQRRISAIHTLWTATTVVAGIIMLWFHPTVRWAIGTIVVLFVVRWIGNMFVHFRYTAPELARIDREFPSPPPLPNRPLSHG